jgi:hypothetical protein
MRNRLVVLAGLVFAVAFLGAQEFQELRINATVETRCKIELSTNFVSFTRTGPPTRGSIPQNEPPVTVIVKTTTRPGERINARIVTAADLRETKTGDTIPAGSIIWTASGSGYSSGNLSIAAPQGIGQWNRSGIYRGTLTFSFRDDPSYTPGTYTIVVTVIVSAF